MRLAEGDWNVRPANKRIQREWQRLRRTSPESTLAALRYWANDPRAPNESVVRPRGKLAERRWGQGMNKKSYEQRGFVVTSDVTAFFIVLDDISTVVITALYQFLVGADV